MSLSHRRRSHRRRVVVAAGLLLATTAGCVQPGPPGVSVNKLSADIVFGVKETPDAPAVAPPNLVSVAPAQAVETLEQQASSPEKVLTIPKVQPLPTRPAAVSECPPAALTAFPEKTAESTVQGLPAEGLYRFKRSIEIANADGVSRSEGFEQRAVRRVTPSPSKPYEFTYQVLQPNYVSGNFTITTFRINSNPEIVQDVNRPPQTIGVVPVPGVEQQVTPPTDEPGLFVDEIRTEDAAGEPESTFSPAPPVKYLPLDEGIVRPGQTFDEVGISTDSLGVLRHAGTVVRKNRVDACGEVVEGWLVESEQTSTDEGGSSRKYFYTVATQYGGLFIAENSIQTLADGTTITIDLSLAGLDPQPLPEALK